MRFFFFLPFILIGSTMKDCDLVSIRVNGNEKGSITVERYIIYKEDSLSVKPLNNRDFFVHVKNINGKVDIQKSKDDSVRLKYEVKKRKKSKIFGDKFKVKQSASSRGIDFTVEKSKNYVVNITLKIPEIGKLETESVNGSISFDGDVDKCNLSTTNGTISINGKGQFFVNTVNGSISGDIIPTNNSEFKTVNGGIGISLIGDDLSVSASVINGVLQISGFDKVDKKGRWTMKKAEAIVGNGKINVKVASTNGAIYIKRR